jgi:demethylmenaquinone methyltransferase/2-methoxy-6-polyprenyl-1,4-benzoquinol methylase
MTPDLPDIVEEQKDYYRARASEYDDWFYRRGRYDFGPEHTQQWAHEAEQVRQHLAQVNLTGHVLEIAAGTGIWTQELLKTTAQVTALDSSTEVLEINRLKTHPHQVTYLIDDIFQWRPAQSYDAVFMGFWLSHVPPARLPGFISLIKEALTPGGKIFLVDSLPAPSSTAKDMVKDMASHIAHRDNKQVVMKRRLGDGREFQIIKIYYDPAELTGLFGAQGLEMVVKKTDNFFLYGWGHK